RSHQRPAPACAPQRDGHARCRGDAAARPPCRRPTPGARLMHGQVIPGAILWLPFAASFLVFVLRGRGRNLAAWLMTCTALACLALTLSLFPAVADGAVLRHAFEWAPS